MLEYGPYIEGVTPDNLTCNFLRFDYNETRIDKLINKFLNNTKRNITQAFTVEFDTIKDKLRNPVEYMEIE